jgi:hypothetical protein
MTGKTLIYGFVVLGLVLVLGDHLLSPTLHAAQGTGGSACAPCGAPCPN